MLRCGRVTFVVASLLAVAPAAANDRFALVIGNQAYNNAVGPLVNPHRDIALVGKSLGEVGFKVLTPRKDATRDDILFAVHELAAQVRTAGRDAVSFLYYAGHGVAVGGENVLIPTNAENTTDAMLSVRGVRLGEVLDILKRDAPDAVHFVVLDACRNIRGRRGDRGFLPVNDRRTGVVIAFSTAPGETATDEGSAGAPYALALAEEITKPGRTDQMVFNAVRTRVVNAASGQTPWTHDGLIGERVVFKAAPAAAPVTVPPPPAQSQLSEAERSWQFVKDTADIRALEVFRKQYGVSSPFFDRLAEGRIEELKKQHVAVATPPPAAKPAVPPAVNPAVLEVPASSPATGAVFRDCPNCPEMVVVPSGSFLMGSPASEPERELVKKGIESPQLKVTIARPFAVGKFAITFDEWDACVENGGCNGYRAPDEGWGRGKRPVIHVNWKDAKAYVSWLSHKTGKTYRLLSEAEREYVTRATTTTPFWWGSSISPTQANYTDAPSVYRDIGPIVKGLWKTVPVDSFAANPWGLYQVHGNVYEWTEDCWNTSHKGNPGNGSARTTGDCSFHVLRGGSWVNGPMILRSADRSWNNQRDFSFGFRVARTLAP